MKIIIDGKAAEVSVSGGGLPEGTVAIKPLTKAEYDALTDEEKQADVAYAITDDAGSSGSSEEIYSTEETRIGTWIDGKPLYRKTFFEESAVYGTNAWAVLFEAPSDVDRLVSLGGSFEYLQQKFSVPLGGSLKFDYFSGSIRVMTDDPNFASNGKNYCAILEYTKTTDTGGAT